MQNIGNRKASQEDYSIMLKAVAKGVKEVEVLDAMCGTGKTYNLFKFISQNPHERYIYVTPSKSEASSRHKEELAKFEGCGVVFSVPTREVFKRKRDHLVDLLQSGKNVSCTHSLFQLLEHAGRELIRKFGYIVIIDEAPEMIAPLKDGLLPGADIELMLERRAIAINEDGRVAWIDETWGKGNSTAAAFREKAKSGCLYASKDRKFFNVQLPIDIIHAGKRVIVSTYQFDGSILSAYLQVKGIACKPFSFDGMSLRDERALKKALADRIEFFDSPATTERLYRQLKIPLNDLAERVTDGSLSYKWYMERAKAKDFVCLGNHIRSTARQMRAKANDLIYTMPKAPLGMLGDGWLGPGHIRHRRIEIKGYSPELCYLEKGTRATNRYENKSAAIHAYNRYLNPAIETYLKDHGAKVSDDSFALAETIQWVFRTTIRKPDRSKLKLHIVSPRRDKLFKTWLHS
jgi:hypothetical protein